MMMGHKKEFVFLFLSVSIFAISLAVFFLQPEITGQAILISGATVTNDPPNLTQLISNQTWLNGTNLTNAFDLDDHFTDFSHDLNFTVTGNSQITVFINQTDHNVSFFPPPSFEGVEYVVFTAHEINGQFNTSSNNVSLNVSSDTDIEPPQWSSPTINVTTPVIRNQNVLFTADWDDNRGLAGYVFAINQSGSWANLSFTTFTGLTNQSTAETLITAAVGATVEWYFFANDTSKNYNITDIQNFTVTEENDTDQDGGGGGGDSDEADSSASTKEGTAKGVGVGAGAIQKSVGGDIEAFFLSEELMRVSLKQTQVVTRTLKVTNTGTLTLKFGHEVLGPAGSFTQVLKEQDFELKAGESEVLGIEFSAKEDDIPDVYTGKILFTATAQNGTVLQAKTNLIIEVNPLEPLFAVNVTVLKDSKKVNPGENVTASVIITALQDHKELDGELYVDLRNLEDATLDVHQEALRIKDGLEIERSLRVPKEAELGEYLFFARLIYEDESSVGYDIFSVQNLLYKFTRATAGIIIAALLFLLFFGLARLYHVLVRVRSKNRILKLYYLLTDAKKLIEEGKFEEAKNVYYKIKKLYREKVKKEILENEELLKQEILTMCNAIFSLKQEISQKEDPEKNNKETKVAEKKEKEKEKPEESSKEIQEVKEKEKEAIAANKTLEKTSQKTTTKEEVPEEEKETIEDKNPKKS